MNKYSELTESNSPLEPSDPDTASFSHGRVSVVADEVSVSAEDLDWISENLSAVCKAAEAADTILDMIVINDEKMARLHGDFLNKSETTDVMTFDLGESDQGPLEGEVYACFDEAVRCAKRRNHSVRKELLLYGVHGLLHLAGYDDHDPDDHKRMHQREDELLAAVGVGPIYSVEDTIS